MDQIYIKNLLFILFKYQQFYFIYIFIIFFVNSNAQNLNKNINSLSYTPQLAPLFNKTLEISKDLNLLTQNNDLLLVTLENPIENNNKIEIAKTEDIKEIPNFFKQKIFEETGYGHQKLSKHTNKNYFMETYIPLLTLSEIPIVSPYAEISFYANQTLTYVRTDNWVLPFNVCLEARFRLEGKRTRFLAYTCQMSEGGECILNKFSALDKPNGTDFLKNNIIENKQKSFGTLKNERCVRLMPWMSKKTPFAFHIKFVRRLRRFNDKATEFLFNGRRNRLGRRATREVGQISLRGFKQCSDACKQDAEGKKWLDTQSIDLSNYMTIKYELDHSHRKRRRLHVKRSIKRNNA